MTSSRLRAVVLAIAASLLAACVAERSDGAPCPLVVSYSQELLTRAASELNSLPAGSAIEEMLADFQVMSRRGVSVIQTHAIERSTLRRKVNREKHALVPAKSMK